MKVDGIGEIQQYYFAKMAWMTDLHFNVRFIFKMFYIIGFKYRNCHQTLDVYLFLLFGWGKFNAIFVTYRLASFKLQVCNLVF